MKYFYLSTKTNTILLYLCLLLFSGNLMAQGSGVIACNTDEPVAVTSSNFTDLTASQDSSGLCTGLLGCSISGSGNLINADLSDFATSTKGVSVGVTHTFRVTDETSGDVFTGGNFAGFLVENTSALQVDLLNNIIIRTYLDGTLQETSDSAGLLGLNSTLLGGGDEFYAGFYTTEDFDAIEISLPSLLSIGGTTRIYHAVTDNLCAGPALECNTPTALAKPEFPAKVVEDRTGFSGVSLGTITDQLNAVDSDDSNFAEINFTLGVAGTANFSVQDALTSYPAQTYAGFDIENTGLLGLDLLGGITITTYLDGVEAESFSGPDELLDVGTSLLTGSTRGQVGFVSSQEFDEVQISLEQVVGLSLGTTRIYGTVLQRFCEGPIECDMPFALTNPTYPVLINNERTGVNGVGCVGCEVDDAQNVVNSSPSDFALINLAVGAASSASLSVESVITDYNPGSIAGFIIRDRNNLVELDLINALTISTYLDGQEQEEFDASEDFLLLNVLNLIDTGDVNPDGAYAVAFEATETYDEVRLTVGSVVGALSSIEVYEAFVDATVRFDDTTVENVSTAGASDGSISVVVSGGTPPYDYLWSPDGQTTPSISNLSAGNYSVTVTDANGCQSTQDFVVNTDGVQTPIDCNTDQPVAITSGNFSDLVVEQSTDGLCIPPLCGISGEDNLINNDLTDFATASTAIGVAVTHTFRVTDETPGDVFDAGNFAGFLIENPTVAQVDLLNAITVRTYLDGVEQESSTSVGLIGMESGLLGSDAYFPGFYTTTEFDAIEISISNVAGILSETNVFYAATETFCPGPALECNTPTALARPEFPARVVDERTGISGIGLGTITNQLNAIDSDDSNFASIDLTLGLASEASFSIKDELTSYPAQTYAGFDIENTGSLGVDLLDGITITTYLDGVEAESFSGSNELASIDSSLLLTGNTRGQVGFVSAQEFDEVQITLSQTVSLDLGSTRIYGAILETFCEGPMECNAPFVISNPAYPVIINNQRTGVDGLLCAACEVDDAQNVVSENPSDFALINITAGVATSASISVESVIGEYDPGTIAGFVIRDRSDLLEANLLNSITIRTYLDGTEQEEFEAADGFLSLEALGVINISPTTEEGVYAVAFETTETYDEVQLSVGSVVGAVNSIEVYGALIDASVRIEGTVTQESAIGANDGSITVDVSGGTPPYEYLWSNGETTPTISNLTAGIYTVTVTDSEGCQSTAQFEIFTDGVQREVPCNTDDPVAITSEGFTDLAVEQSTDGGCVLPLCGGFDEDNLINRDQDDFATARTTVGLGVTHTFRVTDETVDEQFEAGGFAGFLIENNSILQVDLLSSITVRTFLDGTLQEESDTSGLVSVGTTLLGTSEKFNVGFFTNQDYDAIEISISSLAGILSETLVYHAVTSRFCPGPELECNMPTALAKPEFPARIVDEHTGLSGGITLGFIDNPENVIDSNRTNFASVTMLASIAGEASIGVKDEFATYPENTFAGFDIENTSLLNLELLNSITVTTYLDGTEVESNSGASELLATSSALLLTSDEAVRVGFIASQDFDEVQLTIEQGVSVNLGTTRVFGAVLTKLCEGPLECNETFVVSNPDYPVIINNDRTGIEGVACVGCEVDDSQNVISGDPTDFGLINIVAGVASTGSISVEDAIFDYPAGTIAGFVIRDRNDLLEANLLNSLTITTYLDGVEQEEFTNGTSLLSLDVLNITNVGPVSPDGAYAIGFEVNEVFDEVQLTVASVAGVLNSIEIYGQFIDITGTDICNADIAILKEGVLNDENADGCSDAGETIDYTFTVTNEGTAALEDVTVTDPLLGGVVAGPDSGDTDSDGELDVDETWIYIASYAIDQDDIETGSVTNQATAEGTIGVVTVSDLSDDDSILEDDETVTMVCQNPVIAIIKEGVLNDENADGCSDVGETIDYTFTVTNEGNVSLASITVDDPLLGGPIAGPDSGDDNTDGILDIDETWIYTGSYTIDQDDIEAGNVTNQATAEGTAPDATVVDDLSDDDSVLEDDETVTMVCQNPVIALIKEGILNDENADGCSDVGETIDYTFTLTNEGNVSLASIMLDDPLLGGPIAGPDSGDDNSDGILDLDETWIYTASYAIVQADIDTGAVINQATAEGTAPDSTVVTDLSDDDSVLEDDETVTMVCQDSAIALIKTGTFNDENGNGCSDDGETISYTFAVTNIGNSGLTDITVSDPLITVSGGPITLASGDTDDTSFTGTYTITQADITAGMVTNQATVEGTATDGTIVTDLSDDDSNFEDDPTVTDICQNPEIALIKTGTFNDENGDGCSDVGETIGYTFAITNTGLAELTNVTVTDPLITVSGGAITLAAGDMDDTTFTGSYAITQADIDAGMVTNQATVEGTASDGTVVTDLSDDDSNLEDDPTVTIVCQEPAIALIKMGTFNDENANGCSDTGETIDYTFAVTNTGNIELTNVTITDPLITVSGGPITLASGDTDDTSFTGTYTITQADITAGMVTNQATAEGTGSDGTIVTDLSDDDSNLEDDPTVTIICQDSDIALIKMGTFNDENGDDCSDMGETISYTFSVTNTGLTELTNVTITDPLITVSGGPITLAAGATDDTSFTGAYAITQADIEAGMVTNQATVEGTSSDGSVVTDLSDDDSNLEDDPTVTMVCQEPSIALIKMGTFNDENGNGCSEIGETIDYTFAVTNTGNIGLSNVMISDPLITVSGGPITLDPGATDDTSFTGTYVITQPDIDAGIVTNQATVEGTTSDGTVVTDLSDDDSNLEDDPTVTDICEEPSIALIKMGTFNDENGDGCSDEGETISYTFSVVNTGGRDLSGVMVTDPLLTVSGGPITLPVGVTDDTTFMGSYAITQADIDAGMVSNQATAEGTDSDGTVVTDLSDDNSVLEDDPTVTMVCQEEGSMSLEKIGVFNDENGDDVPQVGETVVYSFNVTNTGNITLFNITLTDGLPGVVINGGPIAMLLPGDIDDTTFTASYTITREDIRAEQVVNQALATGEDSNGNEVTDLSDDPVNLDDVDADGDGDPDDPTITILPEVPDNFEIFNAVSPDGDGLNDFFKIRDIELFPDNNLKIFNRWGVKVYDVDGYGQNGKAFKGFSEGRATIGTGEELPTGTYFYVLVRIDPDTGETLENSGYLYINR